MKKVFAKELRVSYGTCYKVVKANCPEFIERKKERIKISI